MRVRYGVLGVGVDAVDPAATVAAAEAWIAAREPRYICFTNVHGIMEARQDEALRRAFNEAGLAVPDGMPLVWLGRLRGHSGVRRVYGPDLTLALCEAASRRGHGCYFYGGAPGVPERLAEALGRRFPGLRTVGTCSPPFRPLSPAEDEQIVRDINAARPDLVFVGLGCPKQERWMADHRRRLEAPLLLGVGAAFDFHAGDLRQAPRWMRSAGLEWLFRLCVEPRRLWRRYLIYNPLFVLHVLAELTGLVRYERPEAPA